MLTNETLREVQSLIEMVTPKQPHRSLVDRLAVAIGNIQSVPKNGQNRHDRYEYATADDVYAAARHALASEGVIVHQQEVRQTRLEQITESKGEKIEFAYKLWFACENEAEEPEDRTIVARIFGTQGYQAAATYALKYWLRSRLLLPTGELDLDAEAGEEKRPAQTKQKQAAQKERPSVHRSVTLAGKKIPIKDVPNDAEALREAYRLLSSALNGEKREEIRLAIVKANEGIIGDMPEQAQVQLLEKGEKEDTPSVVTVGRDTHVGD